MAVWVIYALLAAVFAAGVALCAKVGLAEVDVVFATTIRAVVMALLLVGVCGATARDRVFTADRSALFWIVASGLAGALSWLFYFLALRYGPATPVAALDRTSVAFVLIGAAAFLGEQLTVRSVAGAVLVVLGAILMTYKPG